MAEHLHNYFSTDAWKESHKDKKVNEVVVLYSNATDIVERAKVEASSYDSLTGQVCARDLRMHTCMHGIERARRPP